jgi:flagellar basal-body rod modification protein FlgD
MPTPITPTDLKNTTAVSAPKREPSPTLSKDAFLQLMVAKLQNQDPLAPTSDSEYMAQLAQLTSVEQLMNMSQSMQVSTAMSLIGRTVTYTDPSGEVKVGTVEKVTLVSASRP